MTIANVLRESGLQPVDAELLAAKACGKSRTWIIGHSDEEFDPDTLIIFNALAERRRTGEPVALILGQKEFFGRSFHVTRDTLVPRPATEEIIRTVFDVLDGKTVESVRLIDPEIVAWSMVKSDAQDVKLIVDIGTGSGCIAVTLACERPDLHLIATDISESALMIAQKNADQLHVVDRITFRKGSGLTAAEPIDEPFLLVSNPPYIPADASLDRDVVNFEPHSALFSGKEGTDMLHPLVHEALAHPLCRGCIIECREEQVLKDLPPAQLGS